MQNWYPSMTRWDQRLEQLCICTFPSSHVLLVVKVAVKVDDYCWCCVSREVTVTMSTEVGGARGTRYLPSPTALFSGNQVESYRNTGPEY